MQTDSLDLPGVVAMLSRVCDGIIASEPRLSEADRNIGDGDHGLGMQRGMTAAKEKLAAGGFASVEAAFGAVGMAMMSSMGGASGAIFGTFFRGGGKALAGQERFDSAGLATFLAAGLDGVKSRGKAEPGDKTMVDALQPAAEAAKQCVGQSLSQALEAARVAAEQGLAQTKDMVAKFGRAKSLGEGTLGHPDAGAMSLTLILQFMREALG